MIGGRWQPVLDALDEIAELLSPWREPAPSRTPRKNWTAAETRTLKRMHPDHTISEIALAIGCTEGQVQVRKKQLGLRKSIRRPWSADDDERLRQIYPHRTDKEVAAAMKRTPSSIQGRAAKFGLKKTPEHLAAAQQRTNQILAEAGKAHRFPRGHVPANKGRKGYDPGGRSHLTRFKKGQRPQTWVPIGTEVRDPDGYLKRKIRDDAPPGQSRFNWQFVHVLVWEEHHGPVPKGHNVVFRNGDKADIWIENLECISDAELMRRNTIHNRYPRDLVLASAAKARLTRVINELERKHQA